MFSDIKSYENEISYLKQKKESLKNEMRLQQEGYSKQIENLLEDLSKLRSINNNSNQIQLKKNINSGSNSISNSLVNSRNNKIDDSAIDEDSLSQNMSPVFTSTAEFVKTKTVTIPSHESAPVYVIEAENINESIRKLDNSQEKFEIETKKIKNHSITEMRSNSNNEIQMIESLNKELEQVKLEKTGLENQLLKLHDELKNYQNDNLSLTSKYEQKFDNVNEQLKLLQHENMKLVTENNDLRLVQTKNNTELAQMM